MKRYLFQGQRYRARSKAELLRRLGLKPWDRLAGAIVKLKKGETK